VKKDGAGNTAYLLGKDEQGRSFYATRIKSDGRDAVMVRMPDSLYPSITKTAEGDAPDYVLASIAFGYACHPWGLNVASSHLASAHPEYRFRTRSGRTAHVVTGRDKTIVIIWIEPSPRRRRANVNKLHLNRHNLRSPKNRRPRARPKGQVIEREPTYRLASRSLSEAAH
jgi:hypothetical protein